MGMWPVIMRIAARALAMTMSLVKRADAVPLRRSSTAVHLLKPQIKSSLSRFTSVCHHMHAHIKNQSLRSQAIHQAC